MRLQEQLLVEMQNGTKTLEKSLAISYKGVGSCQVCVPRHGVCKGNVNEAPMGSATGGSLADSQQSECQSSLWSLSGEQTVGNRSGSPSPAQNPLAVAQAGDGRSLDQDGCRGGREKREGLQCIWKQELQGLVIHRTWG